MKKITKTLRRLLQTHQNSPELFEWLLKKHSSHTTFTDEKIVDNRKRNTSAYTDVIKELLSKKAAKNSSMPICVNWTLKFGNPNRYIHVDLKNPKYVAPKKGLKPWGGKNPPKGYYNCNANRHNEYFAFGYTPWSEIIDSPIIFEGKEKISDVEALGAILWEMTFCGWSEKQVENFNKKYLIKNFSVHLKK